MIQFIAGASLSLLLFCCLIGCSTEREYSGYIEGEYVQVAPAKSGRLKTLSVKRGQWVKVNDPLFELDPEPEKAEVQAAVQQLIAANAQVENLKKGKRPEEIEVLTATRNQAQAAFELAEKQFNRNRTLIDTNTISREQYDESVSAYNQAKDQFLASEANLRLGLLGAREDEIKASEATAKAQASALKQALWAYSQKQLHSMVEGYVQDTLFRPGEWVQSGLPIITLLPKGNLRVLFFIPESDLSKIKMGQTVHIRCDACKKPIPAFISYISSKAEFTPPVIFSRESRNKLVYRVEARMSSEQSLHPGQPIDIRVKS